MPGSNTYDSVPKTKFFSGTPRAGATVAATAALTKRHVRGGKALAFGLHAVNGAGSSPTLDVKIQHSFDGITFIDAGVAFTQATTGTAVETKNAAGSLGPWLRAYATIGGTSSPSYTVRCYVIYEEDRTSLPSSPLATE